MLRSVTFAGQLPPTHSFLGNLLRDVLHRNEAVRKEGAGGAENGGCTPRSARGDPKRATGLGSGTRTEGSGEAFLRKNTKITDHPMRECAEEFVLPSEPGAEYDRSIGN